MLVENVNHEVIRERLFERVHKTGEQVKNDLPNILLVAIEARTWEQFLRADGSHFVNLVDWMHYDGPDGIALGCSDSVLTYEDVMKLCEGVPEVYRVLAEQAPNGGKGGRPGKHANGSEGKPAPRGAGLRCGGKAANRKTTLAARLAQEYPDFYQGYVVGRYRSIRAAAEAAGLVSPGHDPLMRLKSYWRKASAEQRDEFRRFIAEDDN